jgi:hypothetical protein
MRILASAALAFVTLTAASPAGATPRSLDSADAVTIEQPDDGDVVRDEPANGWHVDLLARTDFPIDAGGAIDIETRHRIRFGLGVGTIPGGYITAINSVSESAGWYDASTGQFITDSLQSSIVVHPYLGVRPFRRAGLVLDGGLKLAFLGGDSASAELVTAATGAPIPNVPGTTEPYTFGAESLTGLATARIGWVFDAGDRAVIRLDLGGAFTVFSNSTITPPDAVAQPAVWEKLANSSEAYLDGVMNDYVRTATIGLGVGWRVR